MRKNLVVDIFLGWLNVVGLSLSRNSGRMFCFAQESLKVATLRESILSRSALAYLGDNLAGPNEVWGRMKTFFTLGVFLVILTLADRSHAQTQLVSDSFVGTNGTYLGSSWTGCGYNSGAYSKLVYENGAAGGSGYWSTDCALYTGYGPFPGDQYATATVVAPTPSGSTQASVQLRANATPNTNESYIACGWNTQDFSADYHYRIWSLAPGSSGPVSLWLSTISPAVNDIVTCQILGNVVTMTLNGQKVATVADTSGLAGGYPGLYYNDGANSGGPSSSDVIFANFQAGSGPSITSSSIIPGTSTVSTGTFVQYSGTASYSDGTVATMNNWSSSNTAAASIDLTGTAFAAGPGSATITGFSGPDNATGTITVTASAGYTPMGHDTFVGTGGGYLGSNWTGCGYGGGIRGELVYENNQAGGGGYYSTDCSLFTGTGAFPNDQYTVAMVADPSPNSTPEAAVRLRANATPSTQESYIACGWDGHDFPADQHYRIWSLSANGTYASLYLSTITPATNDVIWCQVVGNVVTLLVNGATVASVNDSSGLTSGYPGLSYSDPNGGAPSVSDVIFDNFAAGEMNTVAATPRFFPAGGSYPGTQFVAISDATANATIYFTTNGSTPTTSSATYSGPITVSSSETLEAIATASGYTQSSVATSSYTITSVPPAAAPDIWPVSGTYSGSQSVSITDSTAGAVIYYTTDGSVPSTSSSVFSGSLTVSSTGMIRAMATSSGYGQSPVATANYVIASSPLITGISPISGPIGTNVTISGGNFGSPGTVTFNGVTGAPTSWGNNTVTVPVPAGATTGPIVLTTSLGTSNGYGFTIGAGISGIAPSAGNVGTTVVISGAGFGTTQGSSLVTFNGIPATSSSWSDTSITVAVPTGATTGNVAALVNGNSMTGPIFALKPAITSLTPSSGPIGTMVTISGSSFGALQGNSTVSFGSIAAVPSQWSPNAIVVPVPSGATTGSVVVTVAGQSSNAVSFSIGSTVTGSISGTITQSDGVTPVAGAVVTVFQSGSSVATATTSSSGTYSVSNLAAATYDVRATASGFGTGTQSSVSVGTGQAVTVNILLSVQRTISYTYDKNGRLTTVADSANGSATYTYDPVGNILSIANSGTSLVSVLGFSPTSGPVGTSVSISGIGFSTIPGQNTVVVGGATATVASGTATQLNVTVPSGATNGPIVVTSPNGSATSSGTFSVTTSGLAAPTITSFTPGMGNAGASVTISGTGFDSVPSNDLVRFVGALSLAPVVSAAGTSISVTVPANATSGPISVQTSAGQTTSSSEFFVIPSGYTSSSVDFSGDFSVGQTYTGTITTSGDVGILTFNATAGQQLTLTETNVTLLGSISVLKPDGTMLGDQSFNASNPKPYIGSIPETGYYTILVKTSSNPSSAGSVTFSLSATQTTTTSITPGTATSESLGLLGQNQAFSFTGTAGQLAGVLLTSPTQCGAVISILAPDGTALASGTAGCSSFFLGPVTLPATGTYLVMTATQQQSSVTATLLVSLFNAPSPTTISSAMPVTTTISNPGQNAQLSFSGTAGQLADLQFSSYSFPEPVLISVLSPDGTWLISEYVPTNPSITLTLPSSGTYTIAVSPLNGDTGSFTLTLTLNAQSISTITPGTPFNATISTSGQTAQFVFTAGAGQYASVLLSSSTLPNPTSITILDSQGNWVGDSPSGNALGPVLLEEDDTYTLVIDPSGGTGSATVSLSLSSPVTGGGISSGTLTPFTISTPNQSVQFTFTGTAGQAMSVMLPNIPFADGAFVSVAAPDGTLLSGKQVGGGFSNSINALYLTVAGSYTLTIAPLNGDTGTADAIMWVFNDQMLSITPGNPVGLNIGVPGQIAKYSFTGTSGQSVSVQLTGVTFSCKLAISIVGPDGTTLATNQDNTGQGIQSAYGLLPYQLPVNGTYSLVIHPLPNAPFGSDGTNGPIGSDGSTGSALVALNLQ